MLREAQEAQRGSEKQAQAGSEKLRKAQRSAESSERLIDAF